MKVFQKVIITSAFLGMQLFLVFIENILEFVWRHIEDNPIPYIFGSFIILLFIKEGFMRFLHFRNKKSYQNNSNRKNLEKFSTSIEIKERKYKSFPEYVYKALDLIEYLGGEKERIKVKNKIKSSSSPEELEDILRKSLAPLVFSRITDILKVLSVKEVNSGKEFEQLVARALTMGGYKVKLTPSSNDFGADILAEKDDKRICIQCKFWKKPVGIKAVQEINSAKEYYQCDEAWVIGISGFTRQAVKLANKTHIKLIDFKELLMNLKINVNEDIPLSTRKELLYATYILNEIGWIRIPDPNQSIFELSKYIYLKFCPKCFGFLKWKYIRKYGEKKYACSRFPKCFYLRNTPYELNIFQWKFEK